MLDVASLEHTLYGLHQARVHVEARLRSAQRRKQYHPQVSVQEAAARDEAIALVDLDPIMTRIRATEAKLVVESRSPAANRLRVGAGVARRASFHAAFVTAQRSL